MTKKQYLADLRKRLQFKLSNSDIDDILSDMEECFEAGAAEGKSEEEICLSLGEPKTAARSLIGEQTGIERVKTLSELWLPFIISAGLYAVYTYFGFKLGKDTFDYTLPIMYVLPLIMWVLFERKSFFSALADYKCDFFSFFGSLSMIAAGLAFIEIPKRVFLDEFYDISKYVTIMAVFISAAMLLLAVSLWKNAPKPLSAMPLIVIFFIIYNSVKLCMAYNDLTDPNSAVEIGISFRNILNIIFVCASAFLIWAFIHRNALTLASAYSAITVMEFMFYWYKTLATIDPFGSMYFLKYIDNGKSYLILGAITATAVLVVTIIIKLTKRKKVG